MAELTPMKRQYYEIKQRNPDCLLFFRLGDFYEMFEEDARIASRELDLTLTSRDHAKDKSAELTPARDFRYPGPIPQSKEAAVVMLADTVEAAVRSMASSGKNMEDLKKIIDTLVQDKLDDGQLNDCRLDLKEIEIIKHSFLKMFKGMYHERVAYPKTEEIKATLKAEKEREEETEK